MSWDEGRGNSLWTQMRQCNELPGFDTVFPILLMHSAVDIFPACLPPSFFPLPASSPSLSLFQPIRHDSTSWLLANSQPEDISCVCVCLSGWVCGWVRVSSYLESMCPYFWQSWVCEAHYIWVYLCDASKKRTFNVLESEPQWSESQVCGCYVGCC